MHATANLINLLLLSVLSVFSVKSTGGSQFDQKMPFCSWLKQCLDSGDSKYQPMVVWISRNDEKDTFKIIDIKALAEEWRKIKSSKVSNSSLCDNMFHSLRSHYRRGVKKESEKHTYSFMSFYDEMKSMPKRPGKKGLINWLNACLSDTDYLPIITWVQSIEGQPTFQIIDKSTLAEKWKSFKQSESIRPKDLIRLIDLQNGRSVQKREGECIYSFINFSVGQAQFDSQPKHITAQKCSFGSESNELKYSPSWKEVTAAVALVRLLGAGVAGKFD